MILKDYQAQAIKNLEDFLQLLDDNKTISDAFKNFWLSRDVKAHPPYQNNIPHVPQVCFKVPTGGGKTFMATASLKVIFDTLPATQSKVVVWLVPSETILTQTYKNLSDPNHPYHRALDADFDGQITVYTKEQLLTAENFSPAEVAEQLSIFVLSYDSFRTSNKEGRKAYQQNGQLNQFVAHFHADEEFLSGADESSLIQVIRHYLPVVIVDESHHAVTDLSVEMLKNFNPSFILELTATPKDTSNVIAYVPAVKLKTAGMVKLPVIVYNRHSQDDVISDAIDFRNLLERVGTGKTMAAHAIAKHLGRKILAVNYADIESKYVGETPKNIRKAFEAAAATNSILFFDEADAILSKRVTNMSSATDVSVNQTRSVMLMVMNDYQDFVIFATNFISNFDPAFMRRISTHIEFKLPDLDCRKKLWSHYILPTMPNNIDIDELAEKYNGISGSDISNAVLMAAFKAARQNADLVDKSLVFEAVEETLASKNANAGITVEKHVVSEEYVKERVATGKGVIKEAI